MESNYNYKINTEIKVESRKSYIKNLRAMTLYMEEEVTDDDFHQMALGMKDMPDLETFKIKGLEENIMEKRIDRKREKTDNLLHRLWTKAVGTKDYDKKEWQELEFRIWEKK